MWARTLSEKLPLGGIAGAILALAAAACASDHHVSPWGARAGPSLEAFAQRPDLAGRLAAVDAETRALGLTRSFELEVTLGKQRSAAVIRGYDGADAAGRAVHAVRVATPFGVVMAVGPLDAGDVARTEATELVPALVGGERGGAFRTGTDLNGDGRLDVVLRNERGALSIWHVDGLGSGAYAIAMATPAQRGVDIDGDGRVDLEGELPIAAGDPIAPRLRDVATFEAGGYTDASSAAKAWHRARAAAIDVPKGASPEARLRAAIERAWHLVLSGEPAGNVLRDLRSAAVPEPLRAAFERHARIISSIR